MHLILCNIVFPNSITLIKKKEKGFFFIFPGDREWIWWTFTGGGNDRDEAGWKTP